MGRREFITLLGGAVAMWPLAVRAQQPAMPVIGFLNGGGLARSEANLAAFREGLAEAGYVEGRNVAIHHSWADNQYDRFPGLVAEFVRRQVNLILVAGGGGLAPKAAMAATSTIPIVFTGGFDPIELGVVKSLSRPGGNVTGVSWFANALEAKRLGLLRVVVPQARVIGVLRNPANSSAEIQSRDLAEAARAVGVELHVVDASNVRDFEGAFANLAGRGVGGLIVATDGFFNNRLEDIVALAARHAIPTIYFDRDFVDGGGLMSYAARSKDAFHQAGLYAVRILKGEKAGDLPVMLPTKFSFAINLKTAKAQGLTVPEGLILAADEVIE